MSLETYTAESLSDSLMLEIARVRWKIWPDRETHWTDYVEIIRRRLRAHPETRISILREGERLAAHARVFERELATAEGALPVLALASVFTDPELRGRGYGRRVVEASWAALSESRCAVSLFQTPVPGFYEKLGARTVSNPFINSHDREHPEATPWWDGHVMIYPAAAPWPDGLIDIRGPAW